MYGMPVFFLILSLILFPACRHQRSNEREIRAGTLVKKDDASKKIEEAQSLYDLGEIDAAIASLRVFVDSHLYTPAQDHAYELMIEWLLQLRRNEEARRVASHFMANHRESASIPKIIDLFDKAGKQPQPVPNNQLEQNDDPIFDNQTDDTNDQLLDLEKSVSFAPSEDIKRERLLKMQDYVLHQANVLRVEKIIAQRSSGVLLGFAHLRLAQHYFHLGDTSKSLLHIDSSTPHLPIFAKELAMRLKKEISSHKSVNAMTIGILLPLTGPYAPFGQKALLAIGMALEMPLSRSDQKVSVFEKDDMRIVLADSKGDPNDATLMAHLLIKDYGVSMMVGDIIPEPSFFAAQACQQWDVPILSLSRHPGLSGLGNRVFVFQATLDLQIRNLVTYAMEVKKHSRFAILAPRHNYGMALSKMFFDHVVKLGGSITALEAYDAHETMFNEHVKRLLGMYYLSARKVTPCLKQESSSTFCSNPIRPVIDFDALFIPEFQKIALVVPALKQEDVLVTNNPQRMKAYAAAMKTQSPHYVQLLGPASFNDPTLLKKLTVEIDGAYFVDAVSFEESEALKEFFKTFLQKSETAPGGLEVFAHDAVKLALRILKNTKVTDTSNARKQFSDAIAQFKGEVGLLGPISFANNGELMHASFGFEIEKGEPRVISKDIPVRRTTAEKT